MNGTITQQEFDQMGMQTRQVITMLANNKDVSLTSTVTGSSVRSIQSMLCRVRKKFGLTNEELFLKARSFRHNKGK